MSRRKGTKAAEKAPAEVAASAKKAVAKAKTTKGQRRAAVLDELEETIKALQDEVYQLLLEKEDWLRHTAVKPTLEPTFEDAATSEDCKPSVADLLAQNHALATKVKQLT
ncbi:hypothetical protein AURDEDRAFT_130254 [Auricularia subglabra TFB-10046 SS5]|nr:hypothetical protein AURDEDRAFT_130254 [Auricularia subglabra TFB-10046 SS5]